MYFFVPLYFDYILLKEKCTKDIYVYFTWCWFLFMNITSLLCILLSSCQVHARLSRFLCDISCNTVALPYFTFWYLPGRATIPQDLYPCFSADIHSTLFTSHFIIMFPVWMQNWPILCKISLSLHCTTRFTVARIKLFLITQRKVCVR